LNKILIALGLLFIGAGAVVMYCYSFATTTKDLERPPVNTAFNTWTVSGELKKGDWLIVTYRTNANWTDTTIGPWEEPTDDVPLPHFYVSVSIADPFQNTTTFVEALALQTSVSYPRLVTFPPR